MDFYTYFNNCFKNQEKFIKLINALTLQTNVLIFGGFVRDYLYNYRYKSRDIDIVVDINSTALFETLSKIVENNKIYINRFGGYKLTLNGICIDIWAINDTWAIKKGFFSKNEILKTVYLNIDAYAYDLTNRKFIDDCDAVPIPKTIDICFRFNPNEELNLSRALVLSKKYGISISNRIKMKLTEVLKSEEKTERFLSDQLNHYGKIEIDLNELAYVVRRNDYA